MKNIHLQNFSIECGEVSPCGGSIKIKPIGHFYVLSDINGSIIEEYDKEVNAIIRIDKNDWFRLNNRTLTFDANHTDESKSANITAVYLFKGKKYVATKELIQSPNKEEDFVLTNTVINSINILADKEVLSKNGDEVKLTVIGDFTYIYEQYDSCGNKINEKKERIRLKDITNECQLFFLTPSNGFNLIDNTIVCEKQEMGAKERKCMIYTIYKEHHTYITIKQEKGSEISFSFDMKFKDYPTSEIDIELIDNVGTVSVISRQNMICDGQIIDAINFSCFIIQNNNDWFDVKVSLLGEYFNLTIDTNSRNESKTDDRVGFFDVISQDGIRLRCHVIQPHKRAIDYVYGISIDGDGDYTIDDVEGAPIAFKSYRKVYYDDGSCEVEEISYNDKLNVEYASDKSSILSCSELIMTDFRGNGYITLRLNDKMPFFDEEVTLRMKAFIYDNNTGGIYDSSVKEFTITLKNDLKSKYGNCDVKLVLNKDKNEEVILKDIKLIIETKYGIEVLEKTIPYIWLPDTAKNDVILYETINLLDGMEYRIYDIDGKIKDSTFVYNKDIDKITVNLYLL